MKPILFNTEMVRAIQDGRKTVTRRVLKPHNAVKANELDYFQGNGLWYDDTLDNLDKDTHIKDYSVSPCWITTKAYIQKYAPYKTGDILYVRETWAYIKSMSPTINKLVGGRMYVYRADGGIENRMGDNFWRPSIHMPKEAARIFLRIINVRVERLQDIENNNKEAKREGFSILMMIFLLKSLRG